MKPSKSILGQRNLGTIRARKTAKRSAPQAGNHTELIMKILRMRYAWVSGMECTGRPADF